MDPVAAEPFQLVENKEDYTAYNINQCRQNYTKGMIRYSRE